MNWRTFQFYVYGTVLSIAVFFSILEIMTRTISWLGDKGFTLALHELEPYDKEVSDLYQWHPFTGITFRPNILFEGSHPLQKERVVVIVDQNGFLSKDHTLSMDKDHDEIRIAAIGASTTASINLTFDENWPGRLAVLLEKALPGKKITIINAAVPGFDTAQSVANLALRVMPFHPDIVIIYQAYNDLKAVQNDIAFKPDYSHIHEVPYGFHHRPSFLTRWLNHSMFYVRARNKYREFMQNRGIVQKENETAKLSSLPVIAEITFEQHMQALAAVAQSGGAEVILSSFATLHDPDKDYSRGDVILQLSELQRNELYAIQHFVPGLTINGVFQGIGRYNWILRKVAEELGAGWVDNANKIPHEDMYFVDRVHFSREGAAMMAENLLPIVLEKLGQ